ncbi:xanthine dehydrogenase family protein subunit M [Aquisalimonas lutea]|uniref:FAD binding domain-containing protein n=1 Tax=Aquisalimonas lutea TaxID=1327750 RepID=UPI0025B3193B|nr:xanthine dehydrogenase family protein subunit M [Aquisalimonas lutea]MDN3519322.1 xanthine dehydrogenase family protein subunit M [Aquisalimonas lutea]
MHAFEYHRPKTLDEAAAVLARAEDASPVAGGQTLLQTLRQRLAEPSDLVDLRGIPDLYGITREGDSLRIGAMVRHNEVARSREVEQAIPALAGLAGGIGDAQVRNMGTLGGSIANNDPAADYPAGLLGLGATVHTSQRTIPADEFFVDMFETALEPGEIVRSVDFPIPQRASYIKFAQPASRFALVGVMVSQGAGGVRVAVTGAGPAVFRVPDMEQALALDFSADAIRDIRVPADELNDDIHGTPEYRAHLVTVLARRAVEAALNAG